MTVSLRHALSQAETTRNAFNYWKAEGVLSSKLTQAETGKARALDLGAVLEICFISHLMKAGFPLQSAAERARDFITIYHQGDFRRFVAVNPDTTRFRFFDDMSRDFQSIAGYLALAPDDEEGGWVGERANTISRFTVINIGDVLDRAVKLFEAE